MREILEQALSEAERDAEANVNGSRTYWLGRISGLRFALSALSRDGVGD